MAFIKHTLAATTSDDERAQSRDYASLLLQLDAADPTARRWAARDLRSHMQASDALVKRLQCESDGSVQAVILTSLTRLGDETAVAGLVHCLRSEDAALRNEALAAMQALPVEVAPIMSRLLLDADPDVRILAVNILESLRHPNVEQWLIDVIEHDTQVNVCATAVDLLGEVGSDHAHQALQRLKQRFANEPYIQFATELALKRIMSA